MRSIVHICFFTIVCFSSAASAKQPPVEATGHTQAGNPWFLQGQIAVQQKLAAKPINKKARNIILFIGDGMGVSTVTATRIFEGQQRGEKGEENVLSWEQFPHVALSKTYNENQQVPDSAGTATAIMSGVKTKAGVIGIDGRAPRRDCAASKNSEVMSILELAEQAGLSTGVVTTARLTHATPAATYAHSAERGWESDSDMPAQALADGCIDIAAQLINFPYGNGLEVAMGGGRQNFLPKEMGDPENAKYTGTREDQRDLTKDWLSRYKNSAYVWNLAQFNAVEASKTDHLLGLFEPLHMKYEADRAEDQAGEPALAEMVEKAVQILERNPKGYFLLVEGGRIDHAHHGSNAHRALQDGVALAKAVKSVVDTVKLDETLIIVTADHSHVFTVGGYPTRGNPILGKVIENDDAGLPKKTPELAQDGKPYTTVAYYNGPGAVKTLPRSDISELDTEHKLYKQQALVPLSSESHGGEDVAIYAQGPYAHLINGVMEQHVIFHVMEYAAQLQKRANTAKHRKPAPR